MKNHSLLVASGGPAGGQTFEKFDKQVLGAFVKPGGLSFLPALTMDGAKINADFDKITTPCPHPYGACENAHMVISLGGGRSPRRTPLRFALRNEGRSAMAISFRGGSPRRRRHAFGV